MDLVEDEMNRGQMLLKIGERNEGVLARSVGSLKEKSSIRFPRFNICEDQKQQQQKQQQQQKEQRQPTNRLHIDVRFERVNVGSPGALPRWFSLY
ncbi:GL13617 [Drosophila persimilis]|uniref:GL13617 n=1 Tax=Drosophila persimilis TaxID=7234 RepID=B4GPF5_DROPE|nr:GL13617 [Drosophila persimilis]